MHRLQGLSRGGRLLLALAVGGAVFGIASVVQADIPDSGVIHGCYGKAGTPYKGNLRVRDTSIGEQCRIYENPLDWNQTGPTGVTGPTGPTGPAGPTFVSSGLVFPDGTIEAGTTLGPVPTITHPATGQYGFTVSGLGTGCVLPQLTGIAANFFLTYAGGSCGGGSVTTTVSTSNGLDENWGYLVVGDPPAARPSGEISLPKR